MLNLTDKKMTYLPILPAHNDNTHSTTDFFLVHLEYFIVVA